MKRERASELVYLKWFRLNVDFGPSNGDVMDALAEEFIDATGKDLPEGWNYYQDGETLTDTYNPEESA